jgi:hypothetical protein
MAQGAAEGKSVTQQEQIAELYKLQAMQGLANVAEYRAQRMAAYQQNVSLYGAMHAGAIGNAAPPEPVYRKPTLKDSPLFGYLSWRYDSPLAPLHRWFIRLMFRMQRKLA